MRRGGGSFRLRVGADFIKKKLKLFLQRDQHRDESWRTFSCNRLKAPAAAVPLTSTVRRESRHVETCRLSSVSRVCPRASASSKDVQEHLTQQVPGRHPFHLPKPTQLPPFDVEQQQLCMLHRSLSHPDRADAVWSQTQNNMAAATKPKSVTQNFRNKCSYFHL